MIKQCVKLIKDVECYDRYNLIESDNNRIIVVEIK